MWTQAEELRLLVTRFVIFRSLGEANKHTGKRGVVLRKEHRQRRCFHNLKDVKQVSLQTE